MNVVIYKPSLSAESVPFEKVLAPETRAREDRALLHGMAAKIPLQTKRNCTEKMLLKIRR